jgi:hypothetical protein
MTLQRRALIGGLLAVPLLRPGQAFAQTVSGGPSPSFQRLFQAFTPVGNGADTTEDVLQSYTMPAGQLANIGDTLSMTAWGTLNGTVDNKVVRIRLGAGGAIVGIVTSTLAPQSAWQINTIVIKTGANAQRFGNLAFINGNSLNGSTLPGNSTAGMTDTAPAVLNVTGQDSSVATAGAITCAGFVIDFIRGV